MLTVMVALGNIQGLLIQPIYAQENEQNSRCITNVSDIKPADFDPDKLLRAAMEPGLNVRKLQDLGYTGKGVTIAYVDQPLLTEHNELQNINLYEYSPFGGQSWTVPYIAGVIAMGLQVNPDLTKADAVKYIYDSGYDFKGGKVINPEGFIEMVKKNCNTPKNVVAGQYASKLNTQAISFKEEAVKADLLKQLTEKDKEIDFGYNYGFEGFKAQRMTMRKEGEGAVLTLYYTSDAQYDVSAFLPPDDMLKVIESGIEKGEHQLLFFQLESMFNN